MKYLQGNFSVLPPGTDEYAARWEATFRPKPKGKEDGHEQEQKDEGPSPSPSAPRSVR